MTSLNPGSKSKSSRRNWVKNVALLSAAPMILPLLKVNSAEATKKKSSDHQDLRLIVSTYSYWHFEPVKYPIEKVIENAARIGFDSVEILHRQMESEEREYTNKLKIMRDANFTGFVSLEMEGKEDAETAVPKSYELLRKAFEV